MDERARDLEALYASSYAGFRKAIAAVTGDYEEARDVVQEAFARALRSRASYRGDGSLGAWVWKIALRVAHERRAPSWAPLPDVPDLQLPEPDRDPALAAALASLPPRRRLIVFLHYVGDFSYRDIAAICGVSEGTVGASLAQARASLLEQLRPERALR